MGILGVGSLELVTELCAAEVGVMYAFTFSPSDFNWSTKLSASFKRPPSFNALLGPLGFLQFRKATMRQVVFLHKEISLTLLLVDSSVLAVHLEPMLPSGTGNIPWKTASAI